MPAKMKIRSAYSNLPTAERKVADFILENPSRASLMVINEIADAAGVSVPSVTRLAKKLGYSGFLDFRVALASGSSSIESIKSEPIAAEDTDEAAIEKIFLSSMRALEDTLKATNRSKLSELADKCVAANRIFVVGVEDSSVMAQELAMQMVSMGCDAVAVCNPMLLDALTTRYGTNDVFIGVSHSGRTKMVIDALKAARSNGCYTCFVSNYINSPAAILADAFFCTSCVDDVKHITGRESSISMQALMVSLVTLMCRKGIELR